MSEDGTTTTTINIVGKLFGWIGEHWKALCAAAVVIAIVVPGPYRWFVGLLPKAHYHLGDLANPPNFADRADWKVQLETLDHAQPADRLDTLLSSFGRLIHLPENSHNMPAYNAATETSQDALGREWTNTQCLFVSDIEFVLMQEDGKVDPAGPHGPIGAIGITAAEIKRRTPAGGSRAATYLATLPASAKDANCPQSDEGKRCPRIAVWAYGSPVPCSLSIFSAISALAG